MPTPIPLYKTTEFPGFTAAQIRAGLTVPACTPVPLSLQVIPLAKAA